MKKVTIFSSFLLLFSLSLIGPYPTAAQNKSPNARISFDVGLVLDLESMLGKMSNVCISMALDDFYTTHNNYNTKLILHWRDSKEDDVEAASMDQRLVSNWSRLAVIIWLFVVWILTSSYSASFSSLLTLQQLKPAINDIDDLIKNGDNIGYQQGSYVEDFLMSLKVEESKLRAYSTPEEYAQALSEGTVRAIFDEIPYLRLFLAKNDNCAKYRMAGRIYRTVGFGFVFPKGSPLVPDLNTAILNVTQGVDIKDIEKRWFGLATTCPNQTTTYPSDSLTLDSFWGLFLITGAVSISAFSIFLFLFLSRNGHVWSTCGSNVSFRQRLIAIIRRFDERDLSHYTFRRTRVANEGSEMVTRLAGNSPPINSSVEPTSSNPNRRDSVVAIELEDEARYFQTFDCISPARRRWNLLYRAWRFRTEYARLHE